MTARLAPSGKAAKLGSHINFNKKKFRPGERVLYRPTDTGDFKIGMIDAYTDMSGNWFTISHCTPAGCNVVFATNMLGRVPADADAEAVLRDLASVPIPAPGPGAHEATKAAQEAVLRRHGVE